MTGDRVPAVDRACMALADTRPFEAQRASAGAGTAVYRVLLTNGQRAIVKLFAAERTHGAAEEARLLAAVAASGRVTVPTVIAAGPVPGLKVTALITTDVGTRTLGRAVREGEMPRPAAMMRLALLLNAFHCIQPPPGACGAPGISQQISALAGHCPPSVFARLAPALEVITCSTVAGRPVWCHGDLHLENAISPGDGHRRNGRHAGQLLECVLDFEAATWCVPEYDLAQTLVTCDALAPADRLFLAAAYGQPVDTRILDAFVAFQAVRGWTYAAHREGRHQDMWAARLQQAFSTEPALCSERNTR